MSVDILQWLIFFAILLALVFPVGRYMAKVFMGEHTWLDRVLNPIDNAIYKLSGVDPTKQQRWWGYVKTMLITNLDYVLGPLHYPGTAGCPSAQSGPPGLRQSFPCVQHGCQLHYQHKLAGLCR